MEKAVDRAAAPIEAAEEQKRELEPVEAGLPADDGSHHSEEMPRVLFTGRRAVVFGLFVLSAVGFLYFVLPKLAGAGTTVRRLEGGDTWWIAIGLVLEMLSFLGYVVLFRAVFVRGQERLGWPESYQITMAGVAATRLFATAGAGGVVLTAWALRRSGMEARLVACRMVAFMVLLYLVYVGAVLIDGIGLGTGLFPGGGSFAITFLPAAIAGLLLALAGAMATLPGDFERRLQRWSAGSGRFAHLVARAATVPALAASGIRTAIGRPRNASWGCSAQSLGGALTSRCSGPAFTCWDPTSLHGHRDGLLRRDAREPLAVARRAGVSRVG